MGSEKIQILLADKNEKEAHSFQKEFSRQKDMELLGITENGLDAIALVQKKKADAVLLNLDLPGGTAIDFLYHLQRLEREERPYLVVLADSGYTPKLQRVRQGDEGTVFYRDVPDFGAHKVVHFLRRTIKAPNSKRGKLELGDDEEFNITLQAAREKIATELCTIYITPNLRGHHFIREAVLMLREIPPEQPPYHMTNVIYPSLAEKFHTTPGNVERCIRTALTIAWSKPDIQELLLHIYPAPPDLAGGRPSNRKFLYTYAQKYRKEKSAG